MRPCAWASLRLRPAPSSWATSGIQFAVLFGYADFQFSDGAKLAMKQAREVILKPDWKQRVFNRAAIQRSVQSIVEGLHQAR